MRHLKVPTLKEVEFKGEFWKKRQELFATDVVLHQWHILNGEVEIEGLGRSHCLDNFRIAAGEMQGEFYGHWFADHDLFKWMEAAVYALALYPNTELKGYLDYATGLIEKIQEPDGYINTYYTLKEPGQRFTNFTAGHEFLCLGNLVEAAIAAKQFLHEDKLLGLCDRYISLVYDYVMNADHFVYDGHEEIEIALLKLYCLNGNKKHLELAKRFIDTRGVGHVLFTDEPIFSQLHFNLDYYQAHKPVREQTDAIGHAVRAVYLYTAMARLAEITKDEELIDCANVLYKSITEKKMYLTGGIGSDCFGERFSLDYDLPSDRSYSETCAEVGLMMFCRSLLMTDENASVADVMERTLYNGLLAGVSEDGHGYFYVNPLAFNPKKANYRFDTHMAMKKRVEWMDCPCCPPNAARLMLSLGEYIYCYDEENLYVNLHISSNVTIDGVTYSFRFGEPYGETMTFTVDSDVAKTVWVKVPSYCCETETQNGFIRFDCLEKGKTYTYEFPKKARFVYANANIDDVAAKVAVEKGYLVYCAEEIDNGDQLAALVAEDSEPIVTAGTDGEFEQLKIKGKKLKSETAALYGYRKPKSEDCSIILTPYCHWNNRGEGEMLVWFNVRI